MSSKKKTVPKVLRDLAWSKWIGEDIGKAKCLCCEINDIKMSSFHCGHVIAEVNGGKTEVDNLRPICSACNLSMGSENLNTFKARCGFKAESVSKPIEIKKEEPVPWTPTLLMRGGVVPNLITWVPGTNSLDCNRQLLAAGYSKNADGYYERK